MPYLLTERLAYFAQHAPRVHVASKPQIRAKRIIQCEALAGLAHVLGNGETAPRLRVPYQRSVFQEKVGESLSPPCQRDLRHS